MVRPVRAVTVIHPVGCGDTKPTVVPGSNDQIADARRVAVGELDLPEKPLTLGSLWAII
jgi:hypothetical protein